MKLTPPTHIGDHLKLFADTLKKRQKYIKNDFQAYGLELADTLGDRAHKSLYIRLAKTQPWPLLAAALNFVKDQTPHTVKSKGALFMWKLKMLKSPSNS